MRKTAIAAVAVGALALTSATVSTASAASDPALHVTYDAQGSSTVLKTGSLVPLGPTTLTTVVQRTAASPARWRSRPRRPRSSCWGS